MNEDEFFFITVERMARKHYKKVILTDPGYTYDESAYEYQQAQDAIDEKIQERAAALSAAITVGAGLVAAKQSGEAMKTPLNRRTLLKLGAAGAVAGAEGYFMKTNIEHQATLLKEGEHVMVYNLIDYRDVMIAEGIDCLAQSLSKKMKAALIFGAAHISGIKYYLQNPKIRKMKIELYAPYQKISRPEISVYQFQVDEHVSEEDATRMNFGEWKRTSRANILPKTKTHV